MKKFVAVGIIALAVFCTLIPIAYSQTEREVLEKKQARAKVPADSANYVIGPEDVLDIYVWKEKDLSRTVPVRLDGKISLPLVDEIQAAGLTPLQLKELLMQRLEEFLGVPSIFVIVTEINSFKVYVLGEVKSPGVYRLRSETSFLQIIAMAGGFTNLADRKRILVIRKENGEERRIPVNYKKIFKGDPNSNIILKADDTIIVPD